jgi:ribosomal protein S14
LKAQNAASEIMGEEARSEKKKGKGGQQTNKLRKDKKNKKGRPSCVTTGRTRGEEEERQNKTRRGQTIVRMAC